MTCPPNVFSDAGATPALLPPRIAIWLTRAPTHVGGSRSTPADKFVEYHEILNGGRNIIKLTIFEKFGALSSLELYSFNEKAKFDPQICCKKN